MNISKVLLVLLIAVGLLGLTAGLSAQERQISVSDSPNQTRLMNNSDFGFDVEFKVGDLMVNEIKTKNGVYDELSIHSYAFTNRIGEPKLPVLSRIIAVPVGATVSFDVLSRAHQTLDQTKAQLKNLIVPAQRSISKSEDPALVPFEVNEAVYSRNAFTDNEMFTIEEIGFMRGVRVFQIYYEPVRYNPVSGEIIVSNDVTIRVNFNNPNLAATEELLAKTASYEFNRMYDRSLFNWDSNTRTSIVRYPTKMLILCPPAYTTTLQPYVDWKIQQGYEVTVTTVGTGGTVANTTSAITTYMQGVWAAATPENPAPTYLLIVGDTSTSGNNVIAPTGATGSHPTDLTYVRLQGTDYVPEMYYGRFSVSSATELTNIINKTVTFEKTQMPSLDYLGDVVMIAGVDGTFGPTHGNGQINYGTTYYFNSTQGITSDTYLYPASGSSDAQIIANANEGRGYINYTAHGNQTSWGDPTFTVSDVNAMTNNGKYGIMVGNCCLTNQFTTGVCFGESIIRKANAGGVIYIGGTNNTYWDEDYWWGVGAKGTATGSAPPYSASALGVYDAMFHTHGEAFTDWAQTTGEVIWMGNLAVTQGGSSRVNYYWEIYSIMGDPSLMPYYGVPTANPATYAAQILLGATSYSISGAAPYSRIGLTMNGVIYGAGITDASGNLTLTITPFNTPGTASLVITAQDRITVIDEINVISASGPYMTVDSVVYDDANNDIPEYNESGYFDVTFENVGNAAATAVTATLTTSTPGITITDNYAYIASLAAGATTFMNNAYAITIANNIANGTVANFTITMVGSDTWTHNFNLTLNAPALAFGNMIIQDPAPGNNNGRLDPGETITIIMPLLNNGGAATLAGSATLSSPTPGITVNTGTANFSAISVSGSANLTFSVTADAGMSIGTVANLVFNATSGAYTANKTEATAVGLIIETFETGNFNAYPWTFSGSANWTIDNTTSYNGTYAAKSGAITHNQTSTMQTVRVLTTGGDISFWYKVSSESGYDYLRFYVDGVLQNQWSGTIDWTQATYTLAAGTRTLAWTYSKDVSVDSGSDCAWVDDIIFPASTAPSVYNPALNLVGIPGNGYVDLSWQAPVSGTPAGYKIYRNSSLLTTVPGLTHTDNTVINETTYTYYVLAAYSGGDSDPSNIVTVTPSAIPVTSVIIGTGTSSNTTSTACPINVWYQSLHGQAVYTAAELYAAGVTGPVNITEIGFNVTGLPSLAMPNYIVRMGHTTAANAANWISTGLSTVWTAVSYQPTATGWNMLTLSTPFAWNGTDNIVIDTAFGLIGSYTSSGTTQYTEITNGYIYTRNDYDDQTSVFTGGSTSTYRPNVQLTIQQQQTGPVIIVSPGSLDFGDVAVGASDIKTFTIQNVGSEILSGNITTPTGYTVALAAREADLRSGAGSRGMRNTLAYTVIAGQTKTFNVTFSPTSAIAYNGDIVITSNDPENASLNLPVTGSGYIPLTLNLPDSFSFDKNGSLPVSFSPYITDSSGNPLVLTPSGNTHINIDINDLLITFTAEQNWTGTETITFMLSNGITQVYDNVDVTVNPTAMPAWTPVTYPNNSATVYGVVSIDWTACQLNDWVGAFVGDECRAMAEVTMDGAAAYVTLLVNLASEGETVSFKVYDFSADTVYPVLDTYNLYFGQVVGDPLAIPINAVTSVTLEAPVVTISRSEGSNVLSWEAIPNAGEYHVYRSSDPYGAYTQISATAALQFSDTEDFEMAFYYVKAVQNLAAARN